MEGPASPLNSMLYLWQQLMPFNPTDSCKYRIVTSVKISKKTLLKLQMLLHLKFFSLTSRKVLTNLQGSLTIMAFREQILKRSLNLHQSKTNPREPRMSQMNKLSSHPSNKKTTTISRPSRSLKEVTA